MTLSRSQCHTWDVKQTSYWPQGRCAFFLTYASYRLKQASPAGCRPTCMEVVWRHFHGCLSDLSTYSLYQVFVFPSVIETNLLIEMVSACLTLRPCEPVVTHNILCCLASQKHNSCLICRYTKDCLSEQTWRTVGSKVVTCPGTIICELIHLDLTNKIRQSLQDRYDEWCQTKQSSHTYLLFHHWCEAATHWDTIRDLRPHEKPNRKFKWKARRMDAKSLHKQYNNHRLHTIMGCYSQWSMLITVAVVQDTQGEALSLSFSRTHNHTSIIWVIRCFKPTFHVITFNWWQWALNLLVGNIFMTSLHV